MVVNNFGWQRLQKFGKPLNDQQDDRKLELYDSEFFSLRKHSGPTDDSLSK